MIAQVRMYEPFIGPHDPCPPHLVKSYDTPPQLFLGYQPMNLPQFDLATALCKGTLWPCLFSPYSPRH